MSYALPRVLDLRDFTVSRDSEVAALYSTLKASGKALGVKAQHRGLRRRTKSHNPYRHVLRPNKKKALLLKSWAEKGVTKPRYLRRRRGALQAQIEDDLRKRSEDLEASIRSGNDASSAAPSTSYRLETHRWLVKRMRVQQLDGHLLPAGVYGRGHGRRSVIRALIGRRGVVEDVSYLQCVSLEGPVREIVGVLEHCSASREESRARLQKRGLLAEPPAPSPAEFTLQLGKPDAPPNTCLVVPSSGAAAASCLVWLHPAHAREVGAALGAQCSAQGVTLRALNLRRLELTGRGALKAALRTLQLARPDPDSVWSRAQEALATPSPDQVGKKRKRSSPADLALAKIWKTLAPGSALFLPHAQDPRAIQDRRKSAAAAPAADPSCSLTDLASGSLEGERPPSTGARSQLLFQRAQETLLLRPLTAIPDPAADARVLSATLPVLAAKGFRGSARPSLSLVVPSGWAAVLFQALVLQGVRPLGRREATWVKEEWGS